MSISMPLLTFISPKILDEQQVYLEEWTHSSRLLFYSVLFISFLALPILFCSFFYILCSFRRNSHYIPYLCSILVANFLLLTTLLISVVIENTDLVYDIIPGYLVCKISAFLVNTSSCFIHWTWVAMYVERFFYIFFPLRFRSRCNSKMVLFVILLISMLIQLWTPLFITGRRVDNQFDNIYCGEDPEYSSHTQIIMVVECIGTFFLPLFLTILADISVLLWKHSCSTPEITLVAQENIAGGSRKNSHMKIVSSNSLKLSKKRRTDAIRRCLISATATLFLNLPNYLLQLLDEFFNLKDSPSIDSRRIYLRIDAFVYILYLMQFPITPIHIFLISRTTRRRASRQSQYSGANSLRVEHLHNANCNNV